MYSITKRDKKMKTQDRILALYYNQCKTKDPPTDNITIYENEKCLVPIFKYISLFERPKLALVCKNWKKALVNSWCDEKKIELNYWKCDDISPWNGKVNLLVPLINRCGIYLRELNILAYDDSKIMPLINENCVNLEKLQVRFQHVKNEHFENAFSHMSNLKTLKITFQCESSVPETFIESLKNVAGSLNHLFIANWEMPFSHSIYIPGSFTAILSELKVLNHFEVFGYKMALSSIVAATRKNNEHILRFHYDHWKYWRSIVYPDMPSTQLNIKKFTHLLFHLYVLATDDLLINLANTADNLKALKISGDIVTDMGIIALTKMKKLKHLLIVTNNPNELITDSSVVLFHDMTELCFSECLNLTDYSLIKAVENSPRLMSLACPRSKITYEGIKKIGDIVTARKSEKPLYLSISLGNYNGIFNHPFYLSPYFEVFIVGPEKRMYENYQAEEDLKFPLPQSTFYLNC